MATPSGLDAFLGILQLKTSPCISTGRPTTAAKKYAKSKRITAKNNKTTFEHVINASVFKE